MKAALATAALVAEDPAEAALAAWAASRGVAVHAHPPGATLRTAVAAFAAGHPAVLVAAAAVPDALLDLTLAELAPLVAVLGPDAAGGVALVGLTEIVPALLGPPAALRLDAALAAAFAAGLGVVVLPETGGPG